MIKNVTALLEDNVWLIRHDQNDSTVIYHKPEFDQKVKPIIFQSEYYDYNKPHDVYRKNSNFGWRLITCMFGVCEFTIFDDMYELSRENKSQLLIRPNVSFTYRNISGKSVVHVKSGMPSGK